MHTLLFVLLGICGIGILGCIYMLIRNKWVYKNRVRFIGDGTDRYHRLPSYDFMMNKRPFCWDIDKFLEMGQG